MYVRALSTLINARIANLFQIEEDVVVLPFKYSIHVDKAECLNHTSWECVVLDNKPGTVQ